MTNIFIASIIRTGRRADGGGHVIRRLMTLSVLYSLCGLLAVSCSDPASDAILPPGAYPMTFNFFVVEVEPAKRSGGTADGYWNIGDQVSVAMVNTPWPAVKTYTVTPADEPSKGTLTPLNADNTFSWDNPGRDKTVSAWCCGDGSSDFWNGNGNSAQQLWSVRREQDKTEGDEGDNYRMSDLLYAPPTLFSFSERGNMKLSFYHQTARVVVNIKKMIVGEVGDIAGVEIGYADNLYMVGVLDDSGRRASLRPFESGLGVMGSINAKKLATPNKLADGTDALASYAALVIPQNMQNKKFIAVHFKDGRVFYYTPLVYEDAKLESGKQRTYEITVTSAGLGVALSPGNNWIFDPNYNPERRLDTIRYLPGNLKMGDYYYSDGKTSDGGLRSIIRGDYGIGDYVQDDVSPDLTGGRTCLGIVMKVGIGKESSIDTCSYKLKDGQTASRLYGGYVLALHDANGGNACIWAKPGKGSVIPSANPLLMQMPRNGFSGYNNTRAIFLYGQDDLKGVVQTDFPAAYHAATGYEADHPAPESSSGWYLPCKVQCGWFYRNSRVLVKSMLNAGGDDFSNKNYWSSTEAWRYLGQPPAPEEANVIGFTTGKGYYDSFEAPKSSSYLVRSLLTF